MEKSFSKDFTAQTTNGTSTTQAIPPIGVSVREAQLALEREKLHRQESLKEERKIKSDRVQKEIAELRSTKASNTNVHDGSNNVQEKKSSVSQKPNAVGESDKKKLNKKDKDQTPPQSSGFFNHPPPKSFTPPLEPPENVPSIDHSETKESFQDDMKSIDQVSLEDPEQFPLLILENCQIVDVVLGEITSNHHIIISLDGKIQAMGPATHLPLVKSWMRYDCQNMFILPGLCDAHTNISVPFDPSPTLPRSSASYLALSSSHILKSLLHSGFTTIRDAGGVDAGLLQAISENLLDSPRILSSGMALGPRGAFQDSSRYDPNNLKPISTCPHSINCSRKCSSWCGWSITRGESQLRESIQSLSQYHSISQISLVCGNHCYDFALGPANIKEYPLFSKSEYEAIFEECTTLSVPIMSTCNSELSIERALQIGIRSLDGGLYLTPPLTSRMKDMNCQLVPLLPSCILNNLSSSSVSIQSSPQKKTQIPSHPFSPSSRDENTLDDEGTFRTLFDSVVPNPTHYQIEEYKQWKSLIELASQSELVISYGSNLHSNQYHRFTHTLLNVHAQHLTPLQFLQTLTCNPAKLFNLEDMVGTVSVGAIADLIMVATNPLLDKRWCDSEDSICAVVQVILN